MQPTKLKTLLQQVAKDFDLPESVVSNLTSSYFQQVQKHLTSPTQLAVDVPGLGMFTIKPKALDRKVLRIRTNVERLSSRTSRRGQATRAKYEQELADLEKLQRLLQEETARRQTKRDLRYGNAPTTLSEPAPDSGGPTQ